MDFLALDVETANANMASICEIGVASYSGGRMVDEWKSYVDPEDYFDGINISIHGIDEATVRGAPTFTVVAGLVGPMLFGQIVVTHTPFDQVAISQAYNRYKLDVPRCTWLDSARVARRAWKECATSGYGLSSVCELIGHQFKAHDALEDAKAAGAIVLAAITATGASLSEWLTRVNQPIMPGTNAPIRRAGDVSGPLYGESVVFTGALSMPRRTAADLAAGLGCQVGSSVTKRTTMLVVGDQDISRLAGHEKSHKHRKAEELIRNGQPIRIVCETDFRQLVAQAAIAPAT